MGSNWYRIGTAIIQNWRNDANMFETSSLPPENILIFVVPNKLHKKSRMTVPLTSSTLLEHKTVLYSQIYDCADINW